MHIKKEALKTRQSPMQKALMFGENALKVVGTVKGAYDFGKEAYGFGQTLYNTAQTVAPYVESAVGLML